MTNKKITDLVELTTPTTDDVFPLVDIATNSTKKAQLANLPISTATQTALDAKQATLVSGTNIKTINSTSLLGSGNISIAANPAGTAGQIQFNSGSAFAADSNLYWDNTNKRLGVGTSAPTSPLTVIGAAQFGNASGNGSIEMFDGYYSYSFGKSTSIYNPNSNYTRIFMASSQTFVDNASGNFQFRSAGDTVLNLQSGNLAVGNSSTTPTARLQVKGSGSTSATTSLLVQNSSGTELLKTGDSGTTRISNGGNGQYLEVNSGNYLITNLYAQYHDSTNVQFRSAITSFVVGSNTSISSALVNIDSTTKGFLPPRMTTTQKNAISSPAAGLMVYDTTTNKLCCYNGTSWNDLF